MAEHSETWDGGLTVSASSDGPEANLDGGSRQSRYERVKMRARTIRVKLLLLTAVALASALTGCTSGGSPSADGPVSSSSSRHGTIPNGSQCVPGGGPQTFGDELFTNFGNTTVTLDRVVLLHSSHQRLIGSYAVPGDLLIGASGDWPPRYPGMPATWKHRQPVHGFRLASGKSFNMVLGIVATTSGRATSQGMLLCYHDASGTYVARNYFREHHRSRISASPSPRSDVSSTPCRVPRSWIKLDHGI